MEVVFSTDNLPKRRLIVQSTMVNRFAAGAGRAISMMVEKVARELAQKCVECDDLVQIVADGPFLKLTADCIILTQDELADLMRKQFKAGLAHARGFMPEYDRPTAQGSGDLAAPSTDKPTEGDHV